MSRPFPASIFLHLLYVLLYGGICGISCSRTVFEQYSAVLYPCGDNQSRNRKSRELYACCHKARRRKKAYTQRPKVLSDKNVYFSAPSTCIPVRCGFITLFPLLMCKNTVIYGKLRNLSEIFKDFMLHITLHRDIM